MDSNEHKTEITISRRKFILEKCWFDYKIKYTNWGNHLHTAVSYVSILHYMYQGPYLKEKQHEKWLNTIRLTSTSTCLVQLWLCASIQKFKQIYFHDLNFCEVAFLTVFHYSFYWVLFLSYDSLAFEFEEEKLYHTCKFLYIYKYILGPCQQCKINAFYLGHMLDCFILSDCVPYEIWNYWGNRRIW